MANEIEQDVTLPGYWTRENLAAWDEWLGSVLEILSVMSNIPVERLPEACTNHPQGMKDLLERCEIAMKQFREVNRAQMQALP